MLKQSESRNFLPAGARKRLKCFFYTSSTNKFLQARHFLSRYGVILDSPRSMIPYNEDYTRGKEELLANAIEQVTPNERMMPFFVEDTSLRIDALSSIGHDFPGLEVKEWFQKTSFQQLDKQLQERGDIRVATIKSGIALHLPGMSRPIYLYGDTHGHIANSPPEFRSSPIYPWLSSDSFDGWFIPEGCKKRLAEMGIDESLNVHFRARALKQLAERLAEYSAVLNLPTSAYYVSNKKQPSSQLRLFDDVSDLIIACGKRASGKTIFGEYAYSAFGIPHYEASTVVSRYYREYSDKNETYSEFARRLHATHGDDIVIRTLFEELDIFSANPTIITGLRKLDELSYMKQNGISYRLIYIDTNNKTRYARYLDRARDENVMTYEEFLEEDNGNQEYYDFARKNAHMIIENEFDLQHYLSQINYVLSVTNNNQRPQGIRVL